MPNQGAFSPKTCRTSRMAASPHFNHSANSMRSPRAIASPADVIPGFDRVKIGDSQEDLPRLTRSRNNSYTNAGARSRGNSDGDTMTASSSAKSRAGSVDYGRSSSRLSAPIIVEESKEEMDREDEEDLEIVAAFPGPFGSKSSNGSNGMNNSSTVVMQMDQECPMDDGEAPTMDADDDDNDVRSPEPVCPQPLVTHSPTLPGLGQGQIQRQGSSHRLGYQSLHASEDAAG